MLIERHAVSGDEAFQLLVTSAKRTTVGLVDVASWVVGDAERGRERPDQPTDDR